MPPQHDEAMPSQDKPKTEHTRMLMDFEGEVPLAQEGESVGVLSWAGDDQSHPSIRVLADDREGASSADNHVLAGYYKITSWGGISQNFAEPQDWSGYGGIRFWWRASQDTRTSSPMAGERVSVEIKDGGPDAETSELWITSFLDNWSPEGNRWKLIELPFSSFELRADHQPGSGDTLDGELLLDRAWGYALTFPANSVESVEYRIDDVELYGVPEPVLEAAIVPTPEIVLVDSGQDAVVTVAAVTRRGTPLADDIEIIWTLTEGTAIEGVDFTAMSGTLNFDVGEQSGVQRSFAVPTLPRGGQLEARTIVVELDTTDARLTDPAQITLNAQGMSYQDGTLSIAERVEDLLSRMTLEEKVGQMTQAERRGLSSSSDIIDNFLGSLLSGGGSVPANNTPDGWAEMVDGYQAAALSTRLQIPLLYGIDAVHGHSNMVGATIFPHNIGLGATRDPKHIRAQGKVTAIEVRASGIAWTFAPTLAVTRDERWGRSYESFGEDPALVCLFSAAAVEGLQGVDPTEFDPATEVLATAKHWLGDGSTAYEPHTPGFLIDQGIAYYADLDALWQRDVVPYLPALKAGVGSIMPSYSAVSVAGGQPIRMHEHHEFNTRLLKDRIGFKGFLVTDWEAINKLPGDDFADKVVRTMNSGVDMAMVPFDFAQFIAALTDAVGRGDVTMDRIDDAVRRILRQKFALGLFESPFADRAVTGDVGTAGHRTIARAAVADSQVLLTNDGILPLRADANIYVAGSIADNLGYQMGGWTISWQGGSGATTAGTSIGEAIAAGTSGEVTISPDASAPWGHADVAVIVVGEPPYAEGLGDAGDNGFTLELRDKDREIIDRLSAEMDCVVLIVSGRPQITSGLTNVNALVASWLPGSEGDGVADVLFGRRPFIGRLPVTWPATADQVPINVGDGEYTPEFAFGWGLRTDDPQERLRALAAALPAGPAQYAVADAAGAAYWTEETPENAGTVLGLLQQVGAALRGTDLFDAANLAVSVARDIVQSVIAGGPHGFTIPERHASLTSDAEHALLIGEAGSAVRLLAAAIGITL